MKAYLINMHLLVPRSRSSAKVKVNYKGYISQKMAVSGAFGSILVSQTHLVTICSREYFTTPLKKIQIGPLPNNPWFSQPWGRGPLENNVGKRETCCKSPFSPFLELAYQRTKARFYQC